MPLTKENFDIYKIINNPNTKVVLKCFGQCETEVNGFLTNDTVSLSGTAQFSDIAEGDFSFKELGEKAFGTIGKVGGTIADLAAKGTGTATRPAFTTLAYWNNSEKPNFSIDLLFVRYSMSETNTPLANVKKLVSRCYPLLAAENETGIMGGIYNAAASAVGAGFSIGGKIASLLGGYTPSVGVTQALTSAQKLGFLKAPCAYSPLDNIEGILSQNNYGTSRKSSDGTWLLKIGEWFCASNLVLQQASFELSKETSPDGEPLYAQGSVQLESSYLVDNKTYESWFIKP